MRVPLRSYCLTGAPERRAGSAPLRRARRHATPLLRSSRDDRSAPSNPRARGCSGKAACRPWGRSALCSQRPTSARANGASPTCRSQRIPQPKSVLTLPVTSESSNLFIRDVGLWIKGSSFAPARSYARSIGAVFRCRRAAMLRRGRPRGPWMRPGLRVPARLTASAVRPCERPRRSSALLLLRQQESLKHRKHYRAAAAPWSLVTLVGITRGDRR